MPTSQMDNLNIALLFGGRSCEHEVSVSSASAILQAIDLAHYNLHLIGINKQGHWYLADSFDQLVSDGTVISQTTDNNEIKEVFLPPFADAQLISIESNASVNQIPIDVVFSVLHGPFGEDGHIQGLLNMANMAYVGCDLAASAVAMDKSLTKKILSSCAIPQCPYYVVQYDDWQKSSNDDSTDTTIDQIYQQLGDSQFIKPASMGSSIGIRKAHNKEQLIEAIEHAFMFDNTVVIEQSLERYAEVECSILGGSGAQIEASVLGEIIPNAEFYDYDTKYINSTTETVVPADLSSELSVKIRQCAIDAFKAINGQGMARVDFLVDKSTGHYVLNEINTLPGFTPISMYPKLWLESGLSYDQLIDRLIQLAQMEKQNKTRIKRVL